MSDDPVGRPPGSAASPQPQRDPTIWDPDVEQLNEAECLQLIAPGGVGVLPVLYRLDDGSILFRTPLDSPTDEDLRTGIEGAAYKVSFEIDEVGRDAHEGWMVFIQGDAHHMDSEDDRVSAWTPDIPSSGSATQEHFLRITPTLITGRRLRQR
jgi:hypothetical protein